MATTQSNILDVTLLDPRVKHPTIFKRFDELPDGETLVIHNDHDPKPLYYQMINERGNIFQWQYLEEGPVWWKVKITKHTQEEDTKTIGEILSKDIRKAQVFKKYGIDFCCGGKKTLSEVCKEKGLDKALIDKELSQANVVTGMRPQSYDEWSLDFLADYIVNTHHHYIQKTLPELRGYAIKVANVHGPLHPELIAIHQKIEELAEELLHHLAKEENILFPYVKGLVFIEKEKGQLPPAPFGTVRNPIHMMESEHDRAGELMEEIGQLSNRFTLPEDACASYTLLYRMLQDFEADLHIHIHLENNILFPKAIELERKLGR